MFLKKDIVSIYLKLFLKNKKKEKFIVLFFSMLIILNGF